MPYIPMPLLTSLTLTGSMPMYLFLPSVAQMNGSVSTMLVDVHSRMCSRAGARSHLPTTIAGPFYFIERAGNV